MTDLGPVPGLLTVGQLFLDVVYTALPGAPEPGRETWTSSFGMTPGGIANFAIVGARLGVPTSLVAAVGEDRWSGLCLEMLSEDGVDVSAAVTVPGWSLPVTASLGWAGDRALVTGGTPSPLSSDELLVGGLPRASVATAHLEQEGSAWTAAAAAAGTRVFGDVGWDASGVWDTGILAQLSDCYAFLPNDLEAMAYSRTSDARSAARALAARVELSVVTRGADGVVAVDSGTGEEVDRPVLRVEAVDSTGAGDVFGAALAVASTAPWSLAERIDFACLVAAVTVSRPGGASAAPRLDELVPWLDERPGAAAPSRFDFLRDALAHGEPHPFTPASSPFHDGEPE